MSHLEEQQCDPQAKDMFKKNPQKINSLVDYVTDATREESLIGLQYVVEIKILESDKSVVKCNLCKVKGQMASMMKHLVGTNHIKLYMEKHYFSVVQSLKRTSHHKAHLDKLLKDYAKEIERAEGAQSVKIKYASEADIKMEKGIWMDEEEEILESHVDQKKVPKHLVSARKEAKEKRSGSSQVTAKENKSQATQGEKDPAAKEKRSGSSQVTAKEKKSQATQGEKDPAFEVFDKRHMALNYSEKFKIASREEATIVLNLTQHLSDQLERYFLKYKGLDVLDSTTPDSISTKSTPAPINLSPIVHENLLPQSDASQVIKKEMQWHTEKPSSSVCSPLSVHSFDHMPVEDTKAVKRKSDVFGDASHQSDVLPERRSASEFQSTKKGRHQEPENVPRLRSSSSSYLNDIGSTQHSSAEVSSSHSSSNVATYTHISAPKEKSCVPETFGGNIRMVKDTPQKNIPPNSLNDISKIEAVEEIESLNCTDAADKSEVGAGNNTAIPGPSSSTSNCSDEPSSKSSLSNHAQGKTSNTLSPDMLRLLKGKDAHTVTNILRTLSPFYPALQEVNLEILAQVLVNTGVLD